MAKQHKTNKVTTSKPRDVVRNAGPAKPVNPVDWSGMATKYGTYVLFGILAIAFLLRIFKLDAHSLWVDEYVHVNRARFFLLGKSNLLTDDNNGILLTGLMLPLFKIFGSSPFWARILSVLFGAGMLWLIYKIGARLYNRYVGLLAASFGTISLYMIFWSRMARNYAIFGFFFLLLGWVFLQAWDADKGQEEDEEQDFWGRHGLSGKYLIALPIVLVLSMLSHQLSFFFLFIVGFYSLGMLIYRYSQGTYNQGAAKYLWVSVLFIPFLLTVLVPGLSGIGRALFSSMALSGIGDYAFPEWSRIAQLWHDKPFEAFNVYVGVVRYDLAPVFWLGLAGLFLGFRRSFQSGWWLLSSILFPLLLMSFVYREPFLQRYAIFMAPYMMIAAAVGYWEIANSIWCKVLSKQLNWAVLLFPVLLSLVGLKWDQLSNLVLAKKLEGHVVDSKVAEWAFTNWQEPCDFVRKNGQATDVIMSTVPNAVNYYLDRDDALWFRQNTYNTSTKKFAPNPVSNDGKPGAGSFEDLVRTVEQYPRGWLLGDYYLDNVFTDEKTLLWVYQNMTFHPEASRESGVMVFSWDRSQPKPVNQNFVVEVGKWEDRIQSRVYTVNLPPEAFNAPSILMKLRSQNLNSDREGMILFNNNAGVWLPANKSPNIEEQTISLQKDWVRPGANTIQVLYDTDRTKDPVPGFQLYSFQLYGK